LKVNEETVRMIIEASADAIMLLDEQGFLDCNPATLKMFGCSSHNEFTSLHPSELSPPTQADGRDSREAADEKIGTAYRTGSNIFEWTHQKLNGEVFPAEVQLTLLKLKAGDILQAAVRDISERKKAESELILKDLVFENSVTANSIADSTGIIIHANDTFINLWGYKSRNKVIGKPLSVFLKFDDEEEKIIHALNEAGRWEGEYSALKQDGSTFTAYGLASSIKDGSGDIIGYYSAVMDISGRKQAEEALKAAELYATGVIESARDAFIGIDSRGIIINWNSEARRMFGFSEKEAVGMDVSEAIIPPEFRKAHKAGLKHYLATGVENVLNKHVEITALHKKGHLFPVEMSIVPLERGGVVTFNAFIRDLSERKIAKDALLESAEKLRDSLVGTVDAISKAVDARDPYTAGHQRRVSRLARTIAQTMGLDKNQIEGVRMGATIHDIGKIQLPAEILTKPSVLSELEFEIIKTHAQAGYDILKDVKFPWPIADIAHQHHERLDGSGYPQGLKGDEICLEARIVAVADVVEAVASHRPYRPSLGLDAALEEITIHRGEWYDPDVVDACLKLFKETPFDFDKDWVRDT